MRAADLEAARKLSEQFGKQVRSMRALREHAGELKTSFGVGELSLQAFAFDVMLTPADREYGPIMELLRTAAARQVGETAAALKELGVDVNA